MTNARTLVVTAALSLTGCVARGRAMLVYDYPAYEVETVPVVVSPTSAQHWSDLLTTLAERLDDGRIYDRDVSELLPAMSALILAFNRRVH